LLNPNLKKRRNFLWRKRRKGKGKEPTELGSQRRSSLFFSTIQCLVHFVLLT